MHKLDLILDRISVGNCPFCDKRIELDYKIVEDIYYGKIRICKHHIIKEVSNGNEAEVQVSQ